ncbi:LysM peptidoglycan-binding domain-containing protein [Telluribacter sp. SYSU D00476]|uniref:LysM peptidoglycan-binding domain-containing protein n=1 Tax=Telluribacter sp. SYSU D00476 TaxID=2811430 RepID=UPI001FF568F1|nr:LysM domain-containing protein [Telluribacter sp. SYSU D00476]
MNHNCPVCNKAGLPDYTKSEVVCPQCNSDLKAFLLLNSISTPIKGRFGTYALVGVSLLAILFLGLFIESNIDRKEILATNIILIDSISTLTSNKVNLEKPKEELHEIESKEATVKYVVKKGDYPYKIAQFFYGDGNRYKQIEAENKLEQPYTLKVGQILLIKITQD